MRIVAASACLAVFVIFPFAAAQSDSASGAGGDWVTVDTNEESTFSYERSGITNPREDVLQVTTSTAYTEKGKAQTKKVLKSPVYQNLSESRFIIDIDCRNRKSKLLHVSHYDEAGKELKSIDLEPVTAWEDIPRNARMEKVAEVECRRSGISGSQPPSGPAPYK